jgi:hypothetical protein
MMRAVPIAPAVSMTQNGTTSWRCCPRGYAARQRRVTTRRGASRDRRPHGDSIRLSSSYRNLQYLIPVQGRIAGMIQMDNAVIQIRMATALKQMDAMASVAKRARNEHRRKFVAS